MFTQTAFSWFATSEYLVALFNMANHITSVFEFSNNHLLVTSICQNPLLTPQIGDTIVTQAIDTATNEQVNKKLK